MNEATATTTERRFPCVQCGAQVEFAPGAGTLTCPYCSAQNEIPQTEEVLAEEDYASALEALSAADDLADCLDVKCDACGAEIHGLGSTTSLSCPYCNSNIVATAKSRRLIKPKAILPFRVPRDEAQRKFRDWLRALWFAPGDLKKFAVNDGRLNGMYMPAWTYDCHATTTYTGQRGDYYYVTVPHTSRVNGKSVTTMRKERRVRWRPAAGTVFNRFDDVLVIASHSLPREHIELLEPWDLPSALPYSDDYLAGFGAESYQTDLKSGFEEACKIMQSTISMSIMADIGGDVQRITSSSTRHEGITFKHLLLPVWVSAYRYRGKVYRFLVNARTGEVQGQRPWSSAKITMAVLTGLAIVAAVALVLFLRR